MTRLLLTTRLLFLLASACLLAGSEIPLSPGYEHFYNLEYDQALKFFEQEAAKNPDDLDALNGIGETILYREMFKAGALESELVSGSNSFLRRPKMAASPEAAKRFDDTVAMVLRLGEARVAKHPGDYRSLYALGLAHGLRANYNFLVRKAWLDALKDATAARKLCNRALEAEPSFIDAKLAQGAHDYLVGSLPLAYRVMGVVAGIHGDREQGLKTLHYVAGNGKSNRYDAEVFLAALYRRERRPDMAIPILLHLIKRFPRNYLMRLELAQMYGDAGQKEKSLETLKAVEDLKKEGAPGYTALPEEKIAYYRGTLLFWYNDLEPALQEMKRVTANLNEVDANSGILTWMRIGQIYDLKGNRAAAQEAYKKAIALAPESDAAKEPRQYLSSPYRKPAKIVT